MRPLPRVRSHRKHGIRSLRSSVFPVSPSNPFACRSLRPSRHRLDILRHYLIKMQILSRRKHIRAGHDVTGIGSRSGLVMDRSCCSSLPVIAGRRTFRSTCTRNQ